MVFSEAGETQCPPNLEWLQKAKQGDQAAFADMVRGHYLRVWRFILKSVRNPHDAEELTQEAFFTAWKNLDRFRGESRFSTWLLGIALNIARNHCNRSPSRLEVELPETLQLETLLPEAGDPADLIARKRMLQQLDQAIAALPLDLREIIQLVRLEGIPQEEVAQMLSIPLGTVKSRLSRAREKLNAAMFGEPTSAT